MSALLILCQEQDIKLLGGGCLEALHIRARDIIYGITSGKCELKKSKIS